MSTMNGNSVEEVDAAGASQRVDSSVSEDEEDLLAVVSRRSNGTAQLTEEDRLAKVVAAAAARGGLSPRPQPQQTDSSGSTTDAEDAKNAPADDQERRRDSNFDLLKVIAKRSREEDVPAVCCGASTDSESTDPSSSTAATDAGEDSRRQSLEEERQPANPKDEDLDPELAKVISQRSRDSSSTADSTLPVLESSEEEEEEEDLEPITYSRNAKKRVEGMIQPGAFEAAPGERPSRLQTLSFSALAAPTDDDDQQLSRLKRMDTKEKEQAGFVRKTTQELDPLVPVATATLVDEDCCDDKHKDEHQSMRDQLHQMEMELQALRERLSAEEESCHQEQKRAQALTIQCLRLSNRLESATAGGAQPTGSSQTNNTRANKLKKKKKKVTRAESFAMEALLYGCPKEETSKRSSKDEKKKKKIKKTWSLPLPSIKF